MTIIPIEKDFGKINKISIELHLMTKPIYRIVIKSSNYDDYSMGNYETFEDVENKFKEILKCIEN